MTRNQKLNRIVLMIVVAYAVGASTGYVARGDGFIAVLPAVAVFAAGLGFVYIQLMEIKE